MEKVTIALGSNLGDRLAEIKKTGTFLNSISESPVLKASIWESEPVGGAKFTFLNTIAIITTHLEPEALLQELKEFEHRSGRAFKPVRWAPRILDLDIIYYGNRLIQHKNLIIPHPEIQNRLFVLLPLQEIDKNRTDPVSGLTVDRLIKKAPKMDIHKTNHTW